MLMHRKTCLIPIVFYLFYCMALFHSQIILLTTLLPNFYSVGLLVSCYKSVYASRVENSVDPDQLVYEKPADLENQEFS